MKNKKLVVESLEDFINKQELDEAIGDYFRKNKTYKYNFVAPIRLSMSISPDDIISEIQNYGYNNLENGVAQVERKYPGIEISWIEDDYNEWKREKEDESNNFQEQYSEIEQQLEVIIEDNENVDPNIVTNLKDNLIELCDELEITSLNFENSADLFIKKLNTAYDQNQINEFIKMVQRLLMQCENEIDEKGNSDDTGFYEFLESDEGRNVYRSLERQLSDSEHSIELGSIDDPDRIASELIEDYNNSELEQYFDEDDKKRGDAKGGDYKVLSMRVIDVNENSSEFTIQVTTDKPLSKEDINAVKDYLEGQNSDGWGEGFEQHEIGKYLVHTWLHNGPSIRYVGTQEEVTPSKFNTDKDKFKQNLQKFKKQSKEKISNLNPANYRISINKKK